MCVSTAATHTLFKELLYLSNVDMLIMRPQEWLYPDSGRFRATFWPSPFWSSARPLHAKQGSTAKIMYALLLAVITIWVYVCTLCTCTL